VIVSVVRPVDHGKAWMVRLFNASDEQAEAKLTWNEPVPDSVKVNSPFDDEGAEVTGPIPMPSLGIVTLNVKWED